MDNILFIFVGSAILIAALFFGQRKYYRKVIKMKEHGIVSLIREQDRIGKELHYNNVEKKVMEKMLKEKIDAMVVFRGEREKGEKEKGEGEKRRKEKGERRKGE